MSELATRSSNHERARSGPPGSSRLLVIAFLTSALLDASVSITSGYRDMIQGSLVNPDSYMRLVRLQDMLAAHRPLNMVMRDGSGHGTLLAWSHFLDSLLLLLALPFRLFQNWPDALHSAAYLVGPLSVGLLGASLVWALLPLADRRFLPLAPAVLAVGPIVLGYGHVGVVHHHILTGVVCVMLFGWAWRVMGGDRRAALPLGAWAAAGIWLTPECMPFVLLAFGALVLRWLTSPGRTPVGAAMLRAALAYCSLVTCALAVDPPAGGLFEPEIDRLSIVFVALGAALSLAALGLVLVDRRVMRPGARAFTGLACSILLFCLWLALFPHVALGPGGLVSPAEAHAFFSRINEMQPIRSVPELVFYLGPSLLGAVFVVVRALRHRTVFLAYAAGIMLFCMLLGIWHLRFALYGEIAGAATVPFLLAAMTDRLRERLLLAMLARVSLVVAVVFCPVAAATASPRSLPQAAGPDRDERQCPFPTAEALLAAKAGEVVLADVDLTPELLYRTRVLTVGSLYHPGIGNFMRLRAAWRSPPSEAEPGAVRAAGINLILICPDPAARPGVVADLHRETLYDQLAKGDMPPWLRLVGKAPGQGFALYAVRPAP